MFPLLETVLAFTVVMLVLSFLVKSLTSVVKNHVDYFSNNLKDELERLIHGSVGGNWTTWAKHIPWLETIRWERLGEEFLSKENVARLLLALGAGPTVIDSLEDRLKIHLQNVKYAFDTRTKNISLALGLALCLGLNINAFTIWSTLYHDQIQRGRLVSEERLKDLEKRYAEFQKGPDQAQAKETKVGTKEIQDSQKLLSEAVGMLQGLETDLSFGMGRIWSQDFPAKAKPDKGNQGEGSQSKPEGAHGPWAVMAYEFLGSLLTGLLVSVGAPYWHDLLRLLSDLRKPGGGKGKAGEAA